MEWSATGIEGSFKIVNKIIALFEEYKEENNSKDKLITSKTHKTIKEVTSHIEQFEFNKAIISLMEFINSLHTYSGRVSKKTWEKALESLCLLSSPFIPHICEECWEKLGKKPFVSNSEWLLPLTKRRLT